MKNLFYCLFLIALISCESNSTFDERGNINIAKKITNIIKNENLNLCDSTVSFRMDTLTDFKWDKLYFMYSYGSKKEVLDVIGTRWDELPEDFRLQEGAHLWIFIKNKQVINHVSLSGLYMESSAAFVNRMSDDEKFLFTPQTAIFQFIRRCEKVKDLDGKELNEKYIELIKKE